MRKVVYSLLIIAMVSFSMSSCNKEDLAPTIVSAQTTSLTEGILIKDGVMNFDSDKTFTKTRKWLQKATEEELLNWNKQLKFASVAKWYIEAEKEFCCGNQPEDITLIKKNYTGKVLFEEDENGETEILPLYLTPTLNWFFNEKGIFKIGKSIIKVTGNHLISVPSGNSDKLNLALTTLETDLEKEIFVHEILPNQQGKTFCGTRFQEQSKLSYDRTGGFRKHKLEGTYSWINESVFAGNNIVFIFGGKVVLKSKGKRNNVGFWRCDRATFNWNWNIRFIHNIAPIISIPSPFTDQVAITSGIECNYTFIKSFVDVTVPSTPTNIGAFNNLMINMDLVSVNVTSTRASDNRTNQIAILCD